MGFTFLIERLMRGGKSSFSSLEKTVQLGQKGKNLSTAVGLKALGVSTGEASYSPENGDEPGKRSKGSLLFTLKQR
ncbi:hypothetical protein AZF04_16825 [Alkalihalobacillus trypoxylicola]|uniref:Uncharacterized protein n=1 Tax=Alkalihalobacillus trypoxylicola TaxID=519424 RepID=A0A162ENZ4_9BACI|nr:hypothetical protein AZF04_16825 [Alkalihalobacillus trypoxylicola]